MSGARGSESAAALAAVRERLAEAVTERLYRERPDLLARYGDAGILKCRTDILYNVEYLAPAVELDNDRLFVNYVEWLLPMLAARNVPPDHVLRSLRIMEEVAHEVLEPDHAENVVRPIRAALDAVPGAPP